MSNIPENEKTNNDDDLTPEEQEQFDALIDPDEPKQTSDDDPEYQRKVLGVLIRNPEAMVRYGGDIAPMYFADRSHQAIYRAAKDFYNEHKTLPDKTILWKLVKPKKKTLIDQYARELGHAFDTELYFDHTEKELRAFTRRQKLQRMLNEVIDGVKHNPLDPDWIAGQHRRVGQFHLAQLDKADVGTQGVADHLLGLLRPRLRIEMPESKAGTFADRRQHSQEWLVPGGRGFGRGSRHNTNHERPPLAKGRPAGRPCYGKHETAPQPAWHEKNTRERIRLCRTACPGSHRAGVLGDLPS